MDKIKRFFELKEIWKRANDSERENIDQEITELLNSLSPDELNGLETGITNDFEAIHKENEELEEILTIKEQMDNILPIISVSYLAKHYFGKSTSWFYQRLNGNTVHGKVRRFTQEEIETLNNALKDIGRVIDNTTLRPKTFA